jgi:TolB-like protein
MPRPALLLGPLLASLCLLALPSAAAPAPADKLAVLEFEVTQGLDVDRIYFSDLVRGAVQRLAPQLLVMTRESTDVLLKQYGKSLADCTGECEVEIAKKLSADYVISGRITKVGSRLALTLRLHATADARLLDSEDVRGKDVDELVDLEEGAVTALLTRGGLRKKAPARIAEAPGGTEGHVGEAGAGGQLGEGGQDEVVVRLESEPPGAVVLLDGQVLCQSTPCSKLVSPGAHDFAFSKDGFDNVVKRATAAKGAVVRGVLGSTTARLLVQTSPPGLPLSLDGKPAGTSPGTFENLAPGTHQVLVDDACYAKEGERVVLKKGEERTVRIAARQRTAGLKLLAEDGSGNAVEGRAELDGATLGDLPGTFTVSACAREVSVESGALRGSERLALKEGKVTTVLVKLAAWQAARHEQDDGPTIIVVSDERPDAQGDSAAKKETGGFLLQARGALLAGGGPECSPSCSTSVVGGDLEVLAGVALGPVELSGGVGIGYHRLSVTFTNGGTTQDQTDGSSVVLVPFLASLNLTPSFGVGYAPRLVYANSNWQSRLVAAEVYFAPTEKLRLFADVDYKSAFTFRIGLDLVLR